MRSETSPFYKEHDSAPIKLQEHGDAYGTSTKRLAALQNLKMVLGAHNAPVVPPSVLPGLVAAFAAVRDGTILATTTSPGKSNSRRMVSHFLCLPRSGENAPPQWRELAASARCQSWQPNEEAAEMRFGNFALLLIGVLCFQKQARSETKILGPYSHDNLSIF